MSVTVADDLTTALAIAEDVTLRLQPLAIERLRELQRRLADAHLQVAVLGQFKRGKSSLLNALLGYPLLPMGVLPLTTLATFIRFAETPCLRLLYADGREEQREFPDLAALQRQLEACVTESANPHNRLQLARVEAGVPIPMLRQGVVLLDTPGIGSTLRHNTETARAALAECDAALLVLSPDPPVTEVELAYLADIAPVVTRLLVVLNKVDLLREEERQQITGFLARVLHEEGGLPAGLKIFPVSAQRALAGEEDTGIAELRRYLQTLLAKEGAALLESAIADKAARVLAVLMQDLRLLLRTYEMPLATLSGRAREFQTAVETFTRERQAAADLLAGDRRRLGDLLQEGSDRVLASVETTLKTAATTALAGGATWESARATLAASVAAACEPAQAALTQELEQALHSALARHQERADHLIDDLRRRGAELLELPHTAAPSSNLPQLPRLTGWVEAKENETLSAITATAAERLLPAGLRRRREGRRLTEEAQALARRNVEDIRWGLRQQLDAIFRQFARQLDAQFSEAIAATSGAIDTALRQRSTHAAAAEAACPAFREALARFQQVQDRLLARPKPEREAAAVP
jgi:GTPase Era involved in 16S rRNA processing